MYEQNDISFNADFTCSCLTARSAFGGEVRTGNSLSVQAKVYIDGGLGAGLRLLTVLDSRQRRELGRQNTPVCRLKCCTEDLCWQRHCVEDFDDWYDTNYRLGFSMPSGYLIALALRPNTRSINRTSLPRLLTATPRCDSPPALRLVSGHFDGNLRPLGAFDVTSS